MKWEEARERFLEEHEVGTADIHICRPSGVVGGMDSGTLQNDALLAAVIRIHTGFRLPNQKNEPSFYPDDFELIKRIN